MWVGLLVGLFCGLIIMLAIYGVYALTDQEFDCRKMSEDEYRYKVLGEDYTYTGYYSFKSFKEDMSEENKNKYEQYCLKVDKKSKLKKVFLLSFPVAIFIMLFTISICFGTFLDKQNLNKEIASYQASKHTIEMSLENEDLTGFERVELVKQASEKNEWLAQKQYEVQQWYRFYLDKDAVLKLEPIDLAKGKGE